MLNGASLLKEGNVITTKELCAVLGVAPSTIRLYEKYLPKDPWARGQNNYRGFHFENMLCLLTARLLGSYGISMKESVEVILAGDLTSMDCELGQRVSPLAEERRRASDLIESLDRDRALLAKVPYLLEAYEVIDIPSFFLSGKRLDQGLFGATAFGAHLVPRNPLCPLYASLSCRGVGRWGGAVARPSAERLFCSNSFCRLRRLG